MSEDGLLVGREDELARLESVLPDRPAEVARIAYLEGHPGIGKTTMLGALARVAAERGVRVLAARGEELEVEFGFGVLRGLFERTVAAADGVEQGRLLGGPAHLAEAALGTAPAPDANPDSQFPVLHALYWLVVNLVELGPLLLLVDDAQWADLPSLRFLDHLAARAAGLEVGIVVAARLPLTAATAPGDAADLLARIRDRAGATALNLEALGPEATTAILGRRFGAVPEPRFAAGCHAACAGNPFFLGELIDALLLDRVSPTDAGAEEIARVGPETVARSLRLRLARLPEAAGPVVEAVAVLDAQAELRHVAALTGVPRQEVGALADELVAANVLAAGRPLRFIHPIVREAIDAKLADGARARLHGEAARVLIADGRPATRVAPHVLLTDPAADPGAVELLRDAAAAAMTQGSAELARTYMERALAEPPTAEALPAVLAELGIAEAGTGSDLVAAGRHLEEAAGREDDPGRRAGWIEVAARTRLYRGDLEGAAALLATEYERLAEPDGDLGLRLSAHEAAIGILQPPIATAAIGRLERHLALPGETPAELAVLAELAGKRWLEGRIGDASGFAERALESGALLAAEGPLSVGFNHALAVLIDADRQDLALPALEAGLALAEEQGSLLGVASLLGVRAIAAWKRGEVMAVIADAEALLALLKVSHTPVVDPVQWGYLAAAQAERGDLEGAEASLVRGGCGPELPRLTYTGMPFVARARLRLAQGRPAEALEDLVELEARQAALGVRHLNTPWRHLAVEAALALGERRRALGFATELSELTETWDTPSARGLASAALGLATGGGEGIERLEVGALLLAASPARLDHARVLVRLGETMRREGHRGAARGPLRQGLEAARACGATALASRAHEELVAAGSRPRRLSFSGVESLTASERRVVDLAASGRTNREIAATLLVSIRTVENHLGHAYNKLGIGSRRDLPAALAGPVPEEAGTARRA